MKIDAKWKNDCQGKKDYDAHIVSLSTRYWPAGGGFTLINNTAEGLTGQESEDRPEIKPSATSSIVIHHGDEDFVDVISQDFEGSTFEDVKAQVETWAQDNFDRVVAVIKKEFGYTEPKAEGE